MNYKQIILLLTSALPLTSMAAMDDTMTGNPIITHAYSADPSAHVFNDTLWVYPSHDRDDALSFSMEDYHAYSTTDMTSWQDHGVIFNPLTQTSWAKSAAWAPDCIERNGRYYLYYPTDKKHIGVAVGDSPKGPFHDPLGRPLISIDTPGVVCNRDFIDPCVFIDDDGQAYLFMGQNTVCAVKLNDDMISYDKSEGDNGVYIIDGAEEFFEAVWVHKQGGIYYMSYSDGPFNGHEPQIAYCTAKNPLGPYTYQGVILDPVNSGTNHHSIVNYKGKDYLFYHTADISRFKAPGYHCGVRRNVCVDVLHYNADGTIQKVQPTLNINKVRANTVPTCGVTYPNARPMLQHLIDSVSENGGGKVVVPVGKHHLNGSLFLKSNVELNLPRGAELLFSGNPDDFLPVVQTRWEGTELMGRSAMIYANGQQNVSITGEGTIDANGGKMARWGMTPETDAFAENTHGTHGETIEMPDVRRLRALGAEGETTQRERIFGKGTFLRPCAMEFYGCENVKVEGITLKNSPFWCIHPVYCNNVLVKGVTIDSHFPNNDGCDPESSSNVLIEDCLFRTGDDAVAIKAGRDADGRRVGRASENITIRNCRFYSECNGLCIGSEMSGGVKNVLMENVEIGEVKNALLFKSNLDRGGYISDVTVRNVNIAGAKGAILRLETNYFGYRGGNMPAQYKNFTIENVTAGHADGYGIYYDGPANSKNGVTFGKNTKFAIRDITVRNLQIESAPHPIYLFNTQNCTFYNTKVGTLTIPESPKESQQRQSCDVW